MQFVPLPRALCLEGLVSGVNYLVITVLKYYILNKELHIFTELRNPLIGPSPCKASILQKKKKKS